MLEELKTEASHVQAFCNQMSWMLQRCSAEATLTPAELQTYVGGTAYLQWERDVSLCKSLSMPSISYFTLSDDELGDILDEIELVKQVA